MNYTNKFITIRDWVFTLLIAAIGAVLMLCMFFGAVLQEQDRISYMAVQEVQG